MEFHAASGAYKDLVLFLATAGVLVPLFRRWRISPILGFLAAGVLLGPYGLGALGDSLAWLKYFTVENPAEIAQLAEFGVVFLLFTIGLELSWERLRLMRGDVFGLGAGQVFLSLLLIAAVAVLSGLSIPVAAAIGAALALSSTAIVMPSLLEAKRQHSRPGRAVFAVLLFQDLAVAPILVTLAVLAGQSQEGLSPKLLLAFAPAALGMLALVVVGRLALRPMLRSVAKARSEELFVAACLLVVIGAGLAASLAGLSMALGAFIAGVLLAETEYRHQVEVTIEPFKGLLLGLFFLSVGIGLDLSVVAASPTLVVELAVGLIMVKTLVVLGLARLAGMTGREALETGLLLAGGGEFAFVILSFAIGAGLLDNELGQSLLVAATLSMIAIPFLASLAFRLNSRPRAPEVPPGQTERVEGAIVVVGYGRVGRLVGDMLGRHEIPWVAADLDARFVEEGRRAGKAVYFGDAMRPEFLRRCGLEDARALVVTMDNPEAAEAVVAVARSMRPQIAIVVRARDARHAQRLYELGATDAVPETVEASLQLSETVLVEVGVPMGLVIASIHERRDEYRALLNRPDALGGRGRRFRRAV